MKKVSVIILILLFSFIGCSNIKNQENTIDKEKSEILNSIDNSFEIIDYEEFDYKNSKKEIFDYIYENNDKENTFFSPTSLNLALELVFNGTEVGSNEEKILTNYLPKNHEKRYVNFTNKALDSEGLKVANSIWIDDRYKFNEKYLEKVMEYNPKCGSINTEEPQKSTDYINNWVNDSTEGCIPSIINESSIDNSVRLLLINSLYFNSEWENEWEDTGHYYIFTDFNGEKRNLKKIKTKYCNSYFCNENAEGFSKKYKNGYEFIGILPLKKGDFTISNIDIESFLKSRSTEYEVTAIMTPFRIENNIMLKDILKETELSPLFIENSVHNRGIQHIIKSPDNKDIPLWISDIIQKSYIDITSKGTKAAATTAVIMTDSLGACEGLGKESKEKTIWLDRPFLFLILEPETEEIVFIGKVVSP